MGWRQGMLLLALTVPDVGAVTLARDTANDADLDTGRRQIDGERSDIGFRLRVLFRQLEGRFLSLHGELIPDQNGQHIDIRVRVDARSVSMEKESNGEWARSEEFFDAQRHPEIRFDARAVPKSLFLKGGNIQGDVVLRGITRPIQLRIEPAACERPGVDCDVVASGEVDRSEFGMNSKQLFVGRQVGLTLRIRLQHEAKPAPAPVVVDPPGDDSP